MEFRFRLGERVKHVAHTRDHRGWIGTVCAREFYEDFDGHGQCFYVRWVKPEGEVVEPKQRLPSAELERGDA